MHFSMLLRSLRQIRILKTGQKKPHAAQKIMCTFTLKLKSLKTCFVTGTATVRWTVVSKNGVGHSHSHSSSSSSHSNKNNHSSIGRNNSNSPATVRHWPRGSTACATSWEPGARAPTKRSFWRRGATRCDPRAWPTPRCSWTCSRTRG